MIFTLKQKRDKLLEEMYNKAMKELDEFFGLNWKKNTPNIIIVKNRKEIDKLKKRKTENWVVGWADGITIYLLNRRNYEKESSHKYSKTTYYQLLKHELTHLFFEIISKSNTMNQFIWFNEGLAGFLSGQWKDKKIPEKFEKFLKQYSNWNGNAYNESANAVRLLNYKFGKEKLLKLIKSLSTVKSEKDFNNSFKSIYKSEPTYKFFNNLLNK